MHQHTQQKLMLTETNIYRFPHLLGKANQCQGKKIQFLDWLFANSTQDMSDIALHPGISASNVAFSMQYFRRHNRLNFVQIVWNHVPQKNP